MNQNAQQQPPVQQAEPGPDLVTSMTAAFTKALQSQQPPQQVQQPQLSEEQIDEMLKTYRPNNDLINALFGDGATPDTRMAAFQQMVSGIVENATAHARIIAEAQRRETLQAFHPHMQDLQEISTDRFWGDLYKDSEGLKQFEPFLKTMLPQFQAQPGWPQSRADRVKHFKEVSVPLIKQFQPDFDPAKGGTVTSSTPGQGQSTQNFSNSPPGVRAQNLPSFGGGGSQGHATQGAGTGAEPNRPAWDKSGLGF